MLFNILEQTGAGAGTGTGTGGGAGAPNYTSFILLGVFAVVIIVFMIFNRRSQKKRQQEAQDLLGAIKPGNKVKTIGGICGIVVEVCKDDNTFVLETGTEASGKSFIKFDMQAVYQTDAQVKKEEVKEAPVEEKAEEKVEEKTEEVVEEKTEA